MLIIMHERKKMLNLPPPKYGVTLVDEMSQYIQTRLSICSPNCLCNQPVGGVDGTAAPIDLPYNFDNKELHRLYLFVFY